MCFCDHYSRVTFTNNSFLFKGSTDGEGTNIQIPISLRSPTSQHTAGIKTCRNASHFPTSLINNTRKESCRNTRTLNNWFRYLNLSALIGKKGCRSSHNEATVVRPGCTGGFFLDSWQPTYCSWAASGAERERQLLYFYLQNIRNYSDQEGMVGHRHKQWSFTTTAALAPSHWLSESILHDKPRQNTKNVLRHLKGEKDNHIWCLLWPLIWCRGHSGHLHRAGISTWTGIQGCCRALGLNCPS